MINLKQKLQASLVSNKLQAEILEYVAKLETETSIIGWQINPDRMGGSFSQDEIDRANTWR